MSVRIMHLNLLKHYNIVVVRSMRCDHEAIYHNLLYGSAQYHRSD